MLKDQLKQQIQAILRDEFALDIPVKIDQPADASHGDYSTNIALIVGKKLGANPREVAEKIVTKFLLVSSEKLAVAKAEVAGAGFINFWVSQEELGNNLSKLLERGEKISLTSNLTGKGIMVEYAHPNTHKEMHIGHMRTLITGESIARLLEAAGAKVFRANYQGDIGLHVAKAMFGLQKLLLERKVTLETLATQEPTQIAHFMGQAYARGSKDYEEHKEEIDQINKDLYAHTSQAMKLYEQTREMSLDYFDYFYKKFYTKFDHLFFESEVAQEGRMIVKANIGKVFEQQNGAIVFPGEKYGLHTRVFITKVGNPTYEGKDMGLAYKEYETFKRIKNATLDLNVHIVGSEQAGYFQVIIKALELIDPEKFAGKQKHLSMGMVQLTDRKMSSRTGDVLTIDWLLDQVKEKVELLAKEGRIASEEKEKTIEQIVIGAVKYSVLKVGTGQDVAFDIEKSVSLDGNSGPYLQYVYARTQSVLLKADPSTSLRVKSQKLKAKNRSYELEVEEVILLRTLYKFDETVVQAAEQFSPNILCNYLFNLAQEFNLFYQKVPILKGDDSMREFRLALTAGVGKTVKTGLDLLGIEAPEKM